MSSRINLGDGELGNSLPSWVSDNLGRKSYITDEVNQSPSSGSPTDNSFVYTEYPKMDTSNLTKETSVMTQGDLDKLREKYSFPPGSNLGSSEKARLLYPLAQVRCLYSLSPLPDLGWYYFKARLDKNLFRGSLSNVKRWKKRFFFASGDECEFFPSMPPGEGIPQVPRSWGMPGPGFQDLQEALPCDPMEVSSSGGENTTSGNEGESRLSRGDLQHGSPSRGNSVEYLGVIKGDIGRIARKAFPNISDLTLLRWLEGKVQDPFLNPFPRGPSFSLDSRLKSLSNSGLSPEVKSAEDAPAPAPAAKKGEVDDSKGKEAMLPPPPKRTKFNKGASNAVVRTSTPGTSSPSPGDNLGPGASMMSSAPVARKTLNEVILPANKEKVDQFTTDELVTKSFHALGQEINSHLALLS
ncbi:hypothetical protein CEY00_Acc18432 [Actinidia chinensis var. chinensis]|uniref:Uncharacterized protein n=1 Tax=Actinidia chinensis var. chinensis TaxID=1590841 RepID=A0A2R6QHI1_ACTCC|nr:hypothetical protein CEY00_Acc18432 [Actinidia chinensis var. chinensis]